MTEHEVYLCGWSHADGGIHLFVKAQPTVCARAATYPEAEVRLLEAIEASGGAMHAVLEFAPPLPPSELERHYLSPELLLVRGDDVCDAAIPPHVAVAGPGDEEGRLAHADDFYLAPICRKCRAARAPRNDRPLTLASATRKAGAFTHVARLGLLEARLFSEGFLALLSPDERRQLRLQRVLKHSERGAPRPTRLLELQGPSGPAYVAVKGWQAAGWRCEACGHAEWGYWRPEASTHAFIARADLPSPLPTVFTVGRSPAVQLCMTAARWSELADEPGARGLTTARLGVASSAEILRDPVLRPYSA